jgi:DNA-binding response OmpR family regulator
MSTVLLVTDKQSVVDKVHAALSGADTSVIDHPDPKTASNVAYGEPVDAVLVDMQVGAMGAMAVTRSIRAGAGDSTPIPVTILLDRKADAFIARRAGATNWLTKDFSSAELRAAVGATV